MTPAQAKPGKMSFGSRALLYADGVRAGTLTAAKLARLFWPDALIDRHQLAIIGAIVRGYFGDVQELAVKGCTGSGKGTAVAMGINLWMALAEYQGSTAKVVLTSVRYEHACKILLAEVAKWRKASVVPLPGEITGTQITIDEQFWCRAANPKTGEGFSGVHGPHTLIVFDEASNCRGDFWELAKTQANLQVAISNPRVLSGWFFDLFPDHCRDESRVLRLPGKERRRRQIVTVSAEDCLNVQSGDERIPGQITREQLAAIMANKNPMWGWVFGKGRFPKEDLELQLIGRSWLRRCWRAWRPDMPLEVLGLDVADSDKGDDTVLAAGGRMGVRALFARRRAGTMRTVAWVLRVAKERLGFDLTDSQVPVCVDADGVGAGVADRLEELGCWVLRHRGGATAVDARGYLNWRAETWGKLAERLDPAGPYAMTPFGLPKIEKLAADLCAQERRYKSDAFRMGLMPKDRRPGPAGDGHGAAEQKTVKDKLGRSPDRGDAVAYMHRALMELLGDEAEAGAPADFVVVAPGEDLNEERHRDDRRRRKLRVKKGKASKFRSKFDEELDETLAYYDRRAGLDD